MARCGLHRDERWWVGLFAGVLGGRGGFWDEEVFIKCRPILSVAGWHMLADISGRLWRGSAWWQAACVVGTGTVAGGEGGRERCGLGRGWIWFEGGGGGRMK
ncbi:hypothetical protein HPP92_028397 [Vanilla planifolia]|uniref:Uncharacterized protein n=1 Tax=Vanilla planifolia TaxID=51239 RepID=A0A835U3B0_VANPL|nr:hypothetical protein HPP92_028397 [Vanilla planifolia]